MDLVKYSGPQNILIGDKWIQIKEGISGRLTEYTLQVLQSALTRSKNPTLIISSIERSPKSQASAMYDLTKREGTAYAYGLYGSTGDKVIRVYELGVKAGKSSTQIKSEMTAKIIELNWQFGHGGHDPKKLNVVDVSFRSLMDQSALGNAFKAMKSEGILSNYIKESDHFHIEIPQQIENAENMATDAVGKATNEVVKSTKVVPWTNDGTWNGKFTSDLWGSKSFIGYGSSESEVLNFEHENITNHKRLWIALDQGSRKLFGDNDGSYNPSKQYPIGAGVTLYIPITEVSTISGTTAENSIGVPDEGAAAQTKNQSNPVTYEYNSNITVTKTKEGRYYPKVLKYVSLDPGYTPAFKNRGIASKSIYPRLKVYMWSRSLWLQRQYPFIDVTPHIMSVSTSSTFDGSEFSISLSPTVGRMLKEVDGSREIWQAVDIIMGSKGDMVKLGNINREVLYNDPRAGSTTIGSEYSRSNQYHEKIIQQNDLFLIKFEQLESENDGSLQVVDDKGKAWYDMIGLVDYSEVSSMAENTDVTINVVGRDLTKAFIEDNTYFNPYSIGHAESIYGGDIGSNGRFLAGAFQDIAALSDRTIKQSMEFLFHRISSIGYVPDQVFDHFPNKTEVSTSTAVNENEYRFETKRARGVWQIVKFWIDDNISDLRLVDDSVSNPQGSIWDLMNKIAQTPFVEIFTETLGMQFYVIVRKPPFERNVLSNIVGELQKDTQGGYVEGAIDGGYKGGTTEGPKVSAYEKYLDCLDKKKSATPRDETSSFFDGGLSWEQQRKANELREFKKVTFSSGEEKEFMERYGTVFVDDNVVGCNEGLRAIHDAKFPLIINVNEDDIIRDNFRQTQTAYAWYQVHDKGNFAGQNVSLGHIPAIYFDKYAQVFGNRKLEVTSNYSDFKFFETRDKEDNANLYAEQASQLLAFLVETNIHLPFTREGSFTMNGDRRIKKGNYIYYRPTREVFYVDRVENNISMGRSVDRTTTVTVSRGMVIDYIDGVDELVYKLDGTEEVKTISYFNIVDIEKLRNGIYDTVNGGPANDKFDYKADMVVDEDIMNFFIEKKQFREYGA